MATLHKLPLTFTQEQKKEMDRYLLRLADQIAAPLVMLADISGRLIVYRGRLSASKGMGLAALAGGSFAAGSEIGRFLGLPEAFNQQLLEGKFANLYISSLSEDLLLVVAFTKKTTLGMVRLFTQQAQEDLRELIEAAKFAREEQMRLGKNKPDAGFDEGIISQLDDLFASE